MNLIEIFKIRGTVKYITGEENDYIFELLICPCSVQHDDYFLNAKHCMCVNVLDNV